ncbi:MAG: hypothetical protein WAM82_16435 [Thermoanaerobaculia bacterium]
MGKASGLFALLVFLINPVLLRAAVTCPSGTAPDSSGTACVYQPNAVIDRITPTLTPAAAALALPPERPHQIDAALQAAPPPSPVINDSFLQESKAAMTTICDDNRIKSSRVAPSSMAFRLRDVIEQRCREASQSGGHAITAAAATAAPTPSNPSGSPLSLEQNILVGVTDFIVERAQQELVDYVVQDFSAKLCDPRAPIASNSTITVDISMIFPRACEVLSETTKPDLRQLGSAFEQALRQDLRDFPKVFLNAAITSGIFCKSSPAACKEPAQIALAVYQAVEASRNGGNPVLSLATATAAGNLPGCTNAGDRVCAINFLGTVLGEFATQYKTVKALDPQNADDVEALVDLIATDVLKLVGKDPKLQTFVADVAKFRQTVQALVGPVHQIAADVSNLQGSGLTKQQKADLALDVVENLANVWSIGLPDIEVGGQIVPAERAKLVKIAQDITNAWTAGEQGTYDSLIADLFSLAKDLNINFPIPASVQQYLPLITALATAQKPEDVTAALEKFALPVGSWRDKEDGQHLLNLNAFAGAIAGPTNATGGGSKAYRFAVFAPVGLDYNLNKHWGVFLSMVDLGNLAEIRFHQDNGDTEVPDAHLRDVVSPGLWFRYSIHNTPLVAGFGASLRRQSGSAQTTNGTFWQGGIFFSVDVPLFTLFKGKVRMKATSGSTTPPPS